MTADEMKQLEIDMSWADQECNRILHDMLVVPVTEPLYQTLNDELRTAQSRRRALGDQHCAAVLEDLERIRAAADAVAV